MVTINDIPVFDAVIQGEDEGMMRISLVDAPAVMSDFQKFHDDEKPQMFSVENEEKRLVYGVIMRADFPIYRYERKYGEYYIIYRADTIRQMAEKYIKEGRCNDVNLNHEEGSDVEGVQMVQCFIKDTARGVNPIGFDKIADGSLFGEFHVTNDDVWAEIKAGTYKGFSLEGYFDLVPDEDAVNITEIVDYLEGKFSKLSKKDKSMSKVARMLAQLRAALVAASNATTDKGVIYWEGDEDVKVGDDVFTDEELSTAAEDGEYTLANGDVIVVAGGKVEEIRPVAEGVDPEAEPAEEVAAEDDPKEDEPKEDEPAAEDEPETKEDDKDTAIEERLAALETKVAEIEARFADLEALLGLGEQFAAMRSELDELKKRPAAMSAHDKFKAQEATKAQPRDRRCVTRKTL